MAANLDALPFTTNAATSRPSWTDFYAVLRRNRFVLAPAIVALATIASAAWFEALGHRGASLFFVAALTTIGALFGQDIAIASALLSFCAYKYFIVHPSHSFAIHAPDLLALGVFLLVGLLVGGLSGRLSDRARAATERSLELATLLNASKDLLSNAIAPKEAMDKLLHHLAQIGAPITSLPAELPSDKVGLSRIVLDAGISPTKRRELAEALLEIGGIAIERHKLLEEITQARIVAEREGLRTTMLSSLSHDLRTPIATILASASTLANPHSRLDDGKRQELAVAIQEESHRLNRYIANLLQMTRMESGAINIRSTLIDPIEIADSAIQRTRARLGGRFLQRSYDPNFSLILADPVLIQQAIINLVENAIEHTADDALVRLGVEVSENSVEIFVEDNGPGIAFGEQSLVFQKFFRGESARGNQSGVGLGLSVARGIVEAFDGAIALESPVNHGRGARFTMTFPKAAADGVDVRR